MELRDVADEVQSQDGSINSQKQPGASVLVDTSVMFTFSLLRIHLMAKHCGEKIGTLILTTVEHFTVLITVLITVSVHVLYH